MRKGANAQLFMEAARDVSKPLARKNDTQCRLLADGCRSAMSAAWSLMGVKRNCSSHLRNDVTDPSQLWVGPIAAMHCPCLSHRCAAGHRAAALRLSAYPGIMGTLLWVALRKLPTTLIQTGRVPRPGVHQ